VIAFANGWRLLLSPHDCTGPLVYAASVHFSIWAPNALVQESVRAFYTGWYNELVTHVPQPVTGYFGKPPGPGIGCELLPDVWQRKDAAVRISPA
jgi:galactonate dehydratase